MKAGAPDAPCADGRAFAKLAERPSRVRNPSGSTLAEYENPHGGHSEQYAALRGALERPARLPRPLCDSRVAATTRSDRRHSDEFDAVQNRSGANSLNLAPYPEVA
jgi:hypothetical protein